MAKHYSIVFIGLLLSACATPAKMTRIDIAPTEAIQSTQRVEAEKNYVVGQIQTAYVGQPVIQRKAYLVSIQDKYAGIPAMDISVSSPNVSFMLKQGIAYPATYQVEVDGKRYSAIEVVFEEEPYQILMDETGLVSNKVIAPGNKVETLVNVSPMNARVQISRPGDVLRRDFQEWVELIYSGFSNNQINLSQKQYTEQGTPLPNMSEALTYPANSEHIRYKSVKIKVHKADGEVLIYEVVSE